MALKRKKIVVAIPAYNEELSIGKVISDIHSVMKKQGYNYVIVVTDDGSTDKTVLIAKSRGAVVCCNNRNLGLAETFRREMKKCVELKADIVVHSDADGQYSAQYIPKIIKKVEDGCDLVLGSRFGRGKYSGSRLNRIGNLAFARVFSGLLKTKVLDTTTGFRAFTLEVAKLPLINNFTYTQEQLIRVGKANLRICEVPIRTNKTRKSRLFKNPFSYAIRAWVNILRIYRDFEPLKFFGVVGCILFFIGILIGLYFTYLHFSGGISGHLGLLFLMIILIFSGIQIVMFGLLADMMKK